MLEFKGHEDLALRLVIATLAGKPARVTEIRPDDVNPGLRDYEVSFLRLLETLTNGSVMEISYTGTTLVYRPGLITGGTHSHVCPCTVGVGYFVVPLLVLAPFAKTPVALTLTGVTTTGENPGVDMIRTVFFPILEKFGISGAELRVAKRGSAPAGGGQVVLRVGTALQAQTVHTTQPTSVDKIQGVAYSTRVSPASVNRVIEGARATLKPTEVDTFIYSDAARGEESGLSPGFGVTLVAESRTGWPIAAQAVGGAGSVPEEVGQECARRLLHELSVAGAVGRQGLPLVLVLMALGPEDIGRVLVTKDMLDAGTVRLLRDLRDAFGSTAVFKEGEKVTIVLKGSGFVSASRKIA